ncbi:MAG: hypothetical protein Q4E73_10440 [Lachnospiraceae bacterium]|nr:hypothetical protein [Lachnospiraceae bacterium]
MRKIRLFGKKTFVILGVCAGIAGILFMGYKPAKVEAADSDKAEIEVSYTACENNDEQILYEDVDETISVQVIELQDKGKSYEVSEEIGLKDGYYHQIEKEDGYSVVAGVAIDGQNYVVTIHSQDKISTEDVEQAVADIQTELN